MGRYVSVIEGVNVPVFFSEECFRSALRMQPERGDIFIVTYPSCGTTWMLNLVVNILRKGVSLDRPLDFYLASPFVDQLGAEESRDRMIQPGAFKTHLPLHKVPWSNDAKYIYVARNPKDCCVSFYHHMSHIPAHQFDAPVDVFVEMFVKGDVEYGGYFEHVLPWYDRRRHPNVFFTTYEDMKRDLAQVALGVSKFIGDEEHSHLLQHPELVEEIMHNCSFDVMRRLINDTRSHLHNCKDQVFISGLPKGRRHIIEYTNSLQIKKPSKPDLVRKGEVGSYKTELPEAQNKQLDAFILEKTKHSDIMSLWENIF